MAFETHHEREALDRWITGNYGEDQFGNNEDEDRFREDGSDRCCLFCGKQLEEKNHTGYCDKQCFLKDMEGLDDGRHQ